MNGAPTGKAVPVIRALLMALLHIHHRGRIHASVAYYCQGAINGAPADLYSGAITNAFPVLVGDALMRPWRHLYVPDTYTIFSISASGTAWLNR